MDNNDSHDDNTGSWNNTPWSPLPFRAQGDDDAAGGAGGLPPLPPMDLAGDITLADLGR